MIKKEPVLSDYPHQPVPRLDGFNQYETCLEVVREQIDSALINIGDIEPWLQDVQYMLNQARTHLSKLSTRAREHYREYDDG